MNLRKGYSDSRIHKFKSIDNGGLESFLPQFLLDDVDHHEEENFKDDLNDEIKYSKLFDLDDDPTHFQIFKQSAVAAVN